MIPKNESHPCDEEMLIDKASKGDLDAFNQLVLNYQNMAYYHALALLGDSDHAEDITQESFIKAFRNINRFRGGSFRAWLFRIVTNTSYDMLRRSKQHMIQPLYTENENGEEIESPGWLVDPTDSIQMIVEQSEVSRHLHHALNELPEAYRSVITLIDLNEFDYEEAAYILKVPLGTVKSRLARARLQTRENFKKCMEYGESITKGWLELNPVCS